MNPIPPNPGLIELPGMRGSITIHYDLAQGAVALEAKGLDLHHVVQLLLQAAQGAVGEIARINAGIIRQKPGVPLDEKKGNGDTKDHDD